MKPMTTVHILTEGYASPTGRGFLFPILYHRDALHAAGISTRIYKNIGPGLADCDTLIVDSKFYRDAWARGSAPILKELEGFRGIAGQLLWFDTTDSTGNLQTAVFPVVDRYLKNQVLKDRSLYKKVFYGMRIYTDFYHRTYGIEDNNPILSKPLSDGDLAKLGVSWNCSLTDYSRWGSVRAILFNRLGWNPLLRQPNNWVMPSSNRSIGISSRFTATHRRNTVRFHRQKVKELLGGRINTTRLPRGDYIKEMGQTKIVIAPFSYGEINSRDFEAFINGCLLIKPDMGHMETWPDLYQTGVTYVSYAWDMEDLGDLLEKVQANYDDYIDIARSGQTNYRDSFIGDEARDAFVSQFSDMVRLD